MIGSDTSNRMQLGHFLRSRRARLDPSDFDLVVPKRRRIPGLRREDVAQIAGISPAYYTWIEQGRDVHVSLEVLDAIAGALRLTPSEHTHFFRLCGFDAEEVINVEHVEKHPALSNICRVAVNISVIVFDAWFNELDANDVARGIFDIALDSWPERNAVWQLFFNDAQKRLWADWEEEARVSAGMLRQSAAKNPVSPEWHRLFAVLGSSSEFMKYWNEYEVRPNPAPEEYFRSSPWCINHPTLGNLAMHRVGVVIPALEERIVRVMTPADEDTAAKLSRLLRADSHRARTATSDPMYMPSSSSDPAASILR